VAGCVAAVWYRRCEQRPAPHTRMASRCIVCSMGRVGGWLAQVGLQGCAARVSAAPCTLQTEGLCADGWLYRVGCAAQLALFTGRVGGWTGGWGGCLGVFFAVGLLESLGPCGLLLVSLMSGLLGLCQIEHGWFLCAWSSVAHHE
jgi:hypothetical protein